VDLFVINFFSLPPVQPKALTHQKIGVLVDVSFLIILRD
jgi:hypothetical protein